MDSQRGRREDPSAAEDGPGPHDGQGHQPTEVEEIADQLTSEQRGILACTAIGVNHVAVGMTDRPVQLMVIRGLIVHKGNRYVLTETSRAVFDVLLERGRSE